MNSATILPKKVFLTRGVGRHHEKLASFELALRDAGIAPYNLVKVSSILPPGCDVISRKEGIKQLETGQILFVILSENATSERRRLLSASVGLAVPSDPRQHGYMSEHHAFGQEEDDAGHYAEDLAADMLATLLSQDFDMGKIWKEKRSFYRLSENLTISTHHITQAAYGKEGLWTTVLAAAVCLT